MIDIKDTLGNVRFSTEINAGSKRKFLLMKEDYITLKFSLKDPVGFKLGDYVDDPQFGLFELCDLYKPTYNSSNGGYDYELRMDAYYWKWKNKLFRYIPDAAGREASWNLTATLDVHANAFLRGLAALGYAYKGVPFECLIDDSVDSSAKLVAYDNMNMLDALFRMAETWECECWVTENVIHFGKCEFHSAVDLELGANVVEMTPSNSQGTYATRIYAFGSTRNLPAGYRPVADVAVVNGVAQKRLMLPADTPYIDACPGLTAEEAIESVVVFDDVYPRNVGKMSEISMKPCTDSIENADGTVTKEKWIAYRFRDDGLTFSKDYVLPGEELHVVFQSGVLNGMDFAVRFDPDSTNEQLWEIVRNEDYGRKLPDEVLAPKKGDKYVLYGWDASRIDALGLVSAAEQELKARAIAYAEKVKADPSTYTVKMMSDNVYDADGINKLLEPGDRVKLINGAYWEEGSQSRIIGYEYNLDLPYDSPVYTVGETAAYSKIGELESKLESLTYKGQVYAGGRGGGVYLVRTNDSTPASDSNAYSARRAQIEFLSRVKKSTAAEVITFLKGLLLGEKGHGITVGDNGVVTAALDELKDIFQLVSPGFISGDLGSGFMLKYHPENGRSYLEVDELLVRKLAYFVELVIKQLRHVGGEIILTPASMKCIKVEEVDGAYRCYFEQDNGSKSIEQEFIADDQVRAQTFNIKEGTSHNVSNGYYWRLVTAVGDDYIDLSKTDCDTGSGIPKAGDDIVQMGNRNDTARQNAIILSTVGDDAPSFKQYKGINSYSLKGKETTVLSASLNKLVGEFVSAATGKSYDEMISNLQADFDLVKEQTDKELTLWFFEYEPTLGNIPASEWTTDELKSMHEQDLFYNRLTGFAYRFEKSGSSWGWNNITDQQTVKALENAAKAQDTADGKRRVFVEQPTNVQAYDVGDLWVNATYSDANVNYDDDTLRCCTAKEVGTAFSIVHWKPASKITTAFIKNEGNRILLSASSNGKDYTDKMFSAANSAVAAALKNYVGNDMFDAYKNDTATKLGTFATMDYVTDEMTGKISVYFDENGKLKNTAGLVTGNGTFATLFANAVDSDGNIVKQADISTFVKTDENGVIETGVKINADQIDFIGKTVINGKFVVDTGGNVTMNNATMNNATITNVTISNANIDQVTMTNADVTGKITADSGQVGGIKIDGDSLTNDGFNNDAYIILRNDMHNTFAGIGGNTLPPSSGVRAVARFENNDSTGYFGTNYACVLSATNGNINYALYLMSGFIGGMAVKARQITTNTTLDHSDCWVSCYNKESINVYLPENPQTGKIIFIMRVNHAHIEVYGNGNQIVYASKNVSNAPISHDREINFYLYDGQYWMNGWFNGSV